MTTVVVGFGGNVSDTKRETRLQPLQRLALALFVTAEYQGALGRIEIQSDDIPEFLLELLVRGYLKGPGAVWLQIVCLPYSMNTVR